MWVAGTVVIEVAAGWIGRGLLTEGVGWMGLEVAGVGTIGLEVVEGILWVTGWIGRGLVAEMGTETGRIAV